MTLQKGLHCPNCGCAYTLNVELQEPKPSELSGLEYAMSYSNYLKQKIADKLFIHVALIDMNTRKIEAVAGRAFLFALMRKKFPLMTLNALAGCISSDEWTPDHATVLYAHRKIEDMRTNPTQKKYAQAYRELEYELSLEQPSNPNIPVQPVQVQPPDR